MKRLVLLIALVCISMTGFAQTQMAVLQHNDTITNIFYGTGAFVSAYNSAADGDIINLSAGNFNGCRVAKAITIKGAGARIENGNDGTYFVNNFDLEPTASRVYVEGVNIIGYCSFTKMNGNPNNNSDVQFTRCIMKNLDISDNSSYDVNCNLINCLIESFSMSTNQNSSVNIINCVLYSVSEVRYCQIINSYLSCRSTSSNALRNSSLKNCILTYKHGTSDTSTCEKSNVFVNCVAINMPELFNNLVGGIGSNTHVSSMSEVFETFVGGGINYYEEYILNEDFATSFPGNDGTEVGIHGGIMPFSLDPSYMIVKRCNVAGKSTIDGKLSVDIEIDTEE